MSTMETRLTEHKRNQINDAEKILTRAKAEKRGLTASETREYDELTEEIRETGARLEKLRSDDDNAREATAALSALYGRTTNRSLTNTDREIGDQFRDVIRTRSLQPIDITIPFNEMRSGFRPGIEQRSLATTSGSGLIGTTFYSRLQRHLVESSSILAAGATVLQTATGETTKIPKSTAFSTASIVTEASAISTSDPTLGSVALGAYKYAFLVQVSYELAEDENFDLLGFLAEQSGIAIGNAFGAHAITGTGTGQPRGLLTDATTGVTGPTGTATSFGTHTTAGQGGDLLHDLVSAVAEPYLRSKSAGWLMRAATLNAIRKLRDSTGNYVFNADVVPGSGSAGTLLGYPVYTDPNMPAMAAGAKSIAFGDISKYWVRQVNGIRFERSNDYAFNTDLITFKAAARLDGSLIDTTGAVKTFVHSAT